MSDPRDEGERPMAEPGKSKAGADIGGVAASPMGGAADAMQRSMERGDDTALGRASTGDAAGGAGDPRLDRGGKGAPGSAGDASARSDRPRSDDTATPRADTPRATGNAQPGGNADPDDDEWRHEPVAPVDEPNPLKSIGRAVADTITGGAANTSKKPDR
jgi:hypothetical protein